MLVPPRVRSVREQHERCQREGAPLQAERRARAETWFGHRGATGAEGEGPFAQKEKVSDARTHLLRMDSIRSRMYRTPPSWVAIGGAILASLLCSCGSSSDTTGAGGHGGAAAGGAGGSAAGGAGSATGAGGGGAGGAASGGAGGGTDAGAGGSGGSGGGAGGSGGAHDGGAGAGGQGGASTFALSSPTLADGAMFPVDATCETTKSSSQMPGLMWTGAPAGTMSFAMVFVDTSLIDMTPPNANGFHSAMWNIPGTVSMLPMGLPAGSPPAGVTGLETVQQKKAPSGMAWLGPCPNFPSTTETRTDNYAFELYALSQASLPANTSSMTIQQIRQAILALPPLGKAVLTGKSNAAAATLK
jgi:phosphatidylethanolamine-binding protein (PEBP) family uncharacterized protein